MDTHLVLGAFIESFCWVSVRIDIGKREARKANVVEILEWKRPEEKAKTPPSK
jgi:hypothetical protein